MYIDSHCHINLPELSINLELIIDRMKQNKVNHALVISIDKNTSKLVANFVKPYENFWASVGIHPNCSIDLDLTLEELYMLTKNSKIVAIGETGLDFYNKHQLKNNILNIQKERFRKHIQVAIMSNLPVIVHTRSAAIDTLNILKEEKADTIGGVMHCFTESLDIAKKAIDMNFFISFSGIITFKNAQTLRDIARYIPLDRLLVETDSPFLSPEPHRGEINEPSNIPLIVSKLSEIKQIPVELIAENVSKNFFSLFKKITINEY